MNRFQRFEDIDTSGEQTLPRPPASVTVTVWDLGPQLLADVPEKPDPAATPSAWQDYETDLSGHIAKVLQYRRLRAEWVQAHGGDPVKIETDPVSAREMIERGGGRYVSTLPLGLMPRLRQRA
jgi:hypothetical protein